MKHRKHSKLERPSGGVYHRNEWGVIGAPCSIIEDLVERVREILSEKLEIGWIDADHHAGQASSKFQTCFTDKIDFTSFESNHKIGDQQYRKFFQHLDVLFVNGNHFLADKQIVIINEKKKESLFRKLDRLTDPRLFVLDKGCDGIHSFLEGKWDIPIINIDEVEQIAHLILEDWRNSHPPINGLILAGGKSQRMGGLDKGSITYHGLEQREYMAQIVNQYAEETFLSLRKEQVGKVESSFQSIEDAFLGLGPFGGILSAFQRTPNAAWLTVACDLPYLSASTIAYLIANRDPRKLATCFHNSDTQFPEPLITIWEPRAYPIMLEFLSMGYSCPRKVLINSDVLQLDLKDIQEIKNVNTPEDRDEALNSL